MQLQPPTHYLVVIPNILTMASTIVLDILNHQAALQNNFMDDNAGVIITAEDKQRREKIPKRATLINTCLFIPWVVYTAVLGNAFGFDLETTILILALSNAVVIALRNPLIARLTETSRTTTNETRRTIKQC